MHYWLFKSEPTTFSIDDLNNKPNKIEPWNGVRNYQVRNLLRDKIKVGDLAFFYHSSCKPAGIVGIIKIVKEGYPDDSAWDKSSAYYDAKSTLAKPIWYMVDVQLVKKFERLISLNEIKSHPNLSNMGVTKKGNRLSITSVKKEEWDIILQLSSQ